MSFLEMLDVVNEGLIAKGEDPIAFDSDCREGICGTCGFLINGVPHGPDPRHDGLPAAHARASRTATRVTLEPWRARAFPVDQGPRRRSQRVRPDHPGRRLHVDQRRRRAGRQRHPDPEDRSSSRRWTRPPASAAAPASPPARTPRPRSSPRPRSPTWRCCRRARSNAHARVVAMVERHDAEGFGSCSNEGECEAVCPKEISITNIARMNREYFRAMLLRSRDRAEARGWDYDRAAISASTS